MSAPTSGGVSRWPLACWRLLGVVVHIVRGMALMRWRLGRLDTAGRQQHIAAWSAGLLRTLGISVEIQGQPALTTGLMVSNHVSWLDIAVIHSFCPQARFVSKADVLRWPLLGWMIQQAGTLFIQRERKRDAMRVVHDMAAAMQTGDLVAVFPEGTTGAGWPVLAFHANLFQAAIAVEAQVQPVSLQFTEPGQALAWSAQYTGDTTLAQSLWRIACAKDLGVVATVLAPMHAAHCDRRELAERLRGQIQAALQAS